MTLPENFKTHYPHVYHMCGGVEYLSRSLFLSKYTCVYAYAYYMHISVILSPLSL